VGEPDGAVTDDFAPGDRWTVELWPADAVVLFDWRMSLDWSQVPVRHKAAKQALTDLLTALETQVPVAGVTQAQIDRARHEVSKDMGWSVVSQALGAGRDGLPGVFRAAQPARPGRAFVPCCPCALAHAAC